jgi:hypothetical protein
MTSFGRSRGCIVMAVLAVVSTARAETSSAPIDLEYRNGEGCPNEAAFAARLHERTMGGGGGSRGSNGPRRVLIAVDGSGEAAVGQLTIIDRSGETTTRQISGQSCDQVVDALAFVVALALDPTASAEPPPAPQVSRPPEAPAVEPARPPPGAQWRLSAAAQASMTGALPPGLQLSIPVFVELGDESPPALRRWTPSVRAGFERSFGASLQVPQGAARFIWTAGRLDLCAGFSVAPTLSVGPCVGADMGEIYGVGTIAHPRQASELWLAVGGLVRARWMVRSPLFVEVDAGGVVPLQRNTFVFDPPATVLDPPTVLYEVPPVGARMSGGVGAYFW